MCRQKEPGKVLKLALNPECFYPQLVTVGKHVQLNHMWRSETIQMNAAPQNRLPSSFNANTYASAENGVSGDSGWRCTPRSHLGTAYGSFWHSTTASWGIRSSYVTQRGQPERTTNKDQVFCCSQGLEIRVFSQTVEMIKEKKPSLLVLMNRNLQRRAFCVIQ